MATTATQELQESFLSAIRKSREITLQATKVWVETAGWNGYGEHRTPRHGMSDCPAMSDERDDRGMSRLSAEERQHGEHATMLVG